MNDLHYWAILVATFGAFMISAVWYSVFGNVMAKLQKPGTDSDMPAWKIIVELVRSFAVVFVIAILFSEIHVTSLLSALTYGVLLWIAFPLVYLVGSAIHENVPWKLAALHGGDWLVKLMFIATVIGMWR